MTAGAAPYSDVLLNAPQLQAMRAAIDAASSLDKLVIVQASWATLGDAHDYRQGHIPGAIHLNTDDLETGYPVWRLKPLPALHRAIAQHGIGTGDSVVVYGGQWTAVARVWWVLMYAGVKDVRVLNGGASQWTRAGFALEQSVNTAVPTEFAATPRTTWCASSEEVEAALGAQRSILADVRSEPEFLGEVSGYDHLQRAGRIPGSVHAGNAADDGGLYTTPLGTLADLDAVRERWQRCGLAMNADGQFQRPVIFYCGSGWRSSVAFLCATLMGARNVQNYSDGWCSWSTHYSADDDARGCTPGWRQDESGRPVASGRP